MGGLALWSQMGVPKRVLATSVTCSFYYLNSYLEQQISLLNNSAAWKPPARFNESGQRRPHLRSNYCTRAASLKSRGLSRHPWVTIIHRKKYAAFKKVIRIVDAGESGLQYQTYPCFLRGTWLLPPIICKGLLFDVNLTYLTVGPIDYTFKRFTTSRLSHNLGRCPSQPFQLPGINESQNHDPTVCSALDLTARLAVGQI